MKQIKLTNEAKKREGSQSLLQEIRGKLIMRGDNLQQWSLRNGFTISTTHLVCSGKRGGPKANRIIKQLKEELEIK